MQWKKITGSVKNDSGDEILRPTDGSNGTWHPADTAINPVKVIYRSGGWWSVSAHQSRFGNLDK